MMDQAFKGFGWQGKVVAGGAALALVVIGYSSVAGPAPGLVGAALVLGIAITALVLLTRTPMPAAVRTILMLGLIASVLVFSLRANFMLVTPVRRDVDRALSRADGDRPVASGGSYGGASAPEATEVAVDGLDPAMLGGPIGAGISGAGAWRISGDASPLAVADGMGLSVQWRISNAATFARCGLISVTALRPRQAYALVRDRFLEALRASVRDGAPRCA